MSKKLTSNEQKLTNNEQKLTSNEQKVQAPFLLTVATSIADNIFFNFFVNMEIKYVNLTVGVWTITPEENCLPDNWPIDNCLPDYCSPDYCPRGSFPLG